MNHPPPGPTHVLPPINPPPRPPMASSIPPVADLPPAPRGGFPVKIVAAGAGALVLLLLLVGTVVFVARRGGVVDEQAVVRVVSGNASGTGFFVKAGKGDDSVFVMTAFHVV